MRYLPYALLWALLLFSPAFAQGNGSTGAEAPPAVPDVQNLVFLRANFVNGSSASLTPLILLVRSEKSSTIYRVLTDSSGQLILSLEPGNFELDALYDDPTTPGIDDAATSQISVPPGGDGTLIFYPAGSLAITVLSGGSPFAQARVAVSCPSSSFDYGRINGDVQAQSGPAGEFLFRALPAGKCIVSASADSVAGSAEAQVQHGALTSVSVEMEKKAAPPTADFSIALLAAAALMIAAAVFFLGERGKASAMPIIAGKRLENQAVGRKNQPHSASKPVSSAHAHLQGIQGYRDEKVKAILATLSEREGEIVRHLLSSGGRAKRSQLQHRLLIPKTSLLRNLRSLERKNIVKLTPFGRNLLAELQGSIFQ